VTRILSEEEITYRSVITMAPQGLPKAENCSDLLSNLTRKTNDLRRPATIDLKVLRSVKESYQDVFRESLAALETRVADKAQKAIRGVTGDIGELRTKVEECERKSTKTAKIKTPSDIEKVASVHQLLLTP